MAFCWRLVSIAIIGVGTALLLDTHIPINKKGQWAGIKDMAFLLYNLFVKTDDMIAFFSLPQRYSNKIRDS
jgi:hypothetical protein